MIKKFMIRLEDDDARPKQFKQAIKATVVALGIPEPRILITQPYANQVDVVLAFDEELTINE